MENVKQTRQRLDLNGTSAVRSYGKAGRRMRDKLGGRVRRVHLVSRVVLLGLMVSFAGILWLNQISNMVSLGYEMETMDKKIILLNRQAEELQSQIASFENLHRIEDEAKGRLGMVPATKFIYLKVPASNETPENGRPNTKLYPVSAWWRELTEMLPKPWQGSAPLQH